MTPLIPSIHIVFNSLPPRSVAYCYSLSRKQHSSTMSSPAGGTKRNADHLPSPTTDNKKPKPKGNSITSFFGVPKTKPTSATTPSSFNKEKWVASLTPEQKELLQLEINTLDESWLARLKEEVVTPEFLELKRFLKKEKESGAKIFPPEKDIYSWYSGHLWPFWSDLIHLLTHMASGPGIHL